MLVDALTAAGADPAQADDLISIAWCESRWQPDATNGGVRGLWQLWTGWFDYAGADRDQWQDPYVQAQVAVAVVAYDVARGYAPYAQWVCQP